MAARSTTRPASAKTAKAGPKPKIFVTDEDMLHFQKKDGGEIILDLEMLAARDLEQDEQFEIVMKALGDEALQEEVNGLGALEYMRLVTGFFNEFEKALGLSLGESEGSSNSSTSTE
jgi:hypothetical protein